MRRHYLEWCGVTGVALLASGCGQQAGTEGGPGNERPGAKGEVGEVGGGGESEASEAGPGEGGESSER